MNIGNLCYSCMKEKQDKDIDCPNCGYINGSEMSEHYYLPEGTILAERYLVGRVLGHGGFGITYIGFDQKLQVKVAVKEYLPSEVATRTEGQSTVKSFSGDKKDQFNYGLERFIDEARSLAKYNHHPCIVSTTDFFEENNTAYLVMEYLEGIALNEYLKRKGGKIAFKEALEIMMPVMDALREVHQSGMIHRDVSPDNIYITSKGQIKLLDFGAARFALGEKSKSLSVILKPGFAPPEQYSSRGKQGAWTDVYSVAATIYRMITGENLPEAMDRMMDDTLSIPSDITSNIKEALVKALQLRHEDRIKSIEELQQSLLGMSKKEKPISDLNVNKKKEDLINNNKSKKEIVNFSKAISNIKISKRSVLKSLLVIIVIVFLVINSRPYKERLDFKRSMEKFESVKLLMNKHNIYNEQTRMAIFKNKYVKDIEVEYQYSNKKINEIIKFHFVGEEKLKLIISKGEENSILRQAENPLDSLNPHKLNRYSEKVAKLIHGNLLELLYDKETDKHKIIGFHAEGLPTRSSDGTVWTFRLRENITWSDGTPIDAYTYEESYKILLDSRITKQRPYIFMNQVRIANAEKYYNGEVSNWSWVGIKALDRYTLQFTTEHPTPEIDIQLTWAGGGETSPVKIDVFSEKSYCTSLETTPCSGAYRLVEWTKDSFRKYEKRDDTPVSKYYVPKTIEGVITDSEASLAHFENGDIDITQISLEYYKNYKGDPRLKLLPSPVVWSMYINMTSKEKAFLRDANFRKALFFAMNRIAITEQIYKTYKPTPYVVSTVAIADSKAGTFYRDTPQAKAVMPNNNGYNLKLAREYMQKAFSKYGKMKVELLYFNNSENMKLMAELIKQEYEMVFGEDIINITLEGVPWDDSYNRIQDGAYDLAFVGWYNSTFNPWFSLQHFTSSSPSKYNQFYSSEFDYLYERATKGDLIFKTDERLQALADMEQMLLSTVPFIPIMQRQDPYLVADRVPLVTGGNIPEVGLGIYQSELDPLDIK